MSRVIRGQLVTLFAMLVTIAVTLVACGGGSSSVGGGGGTSGATIMGKVDNGVAAVYPAGGERRLLIAVADVLVESSYAAGVPGVTVELYDSGNNLVGSQTTGADGSFMFTGLNPDDYTIRLSQGGNPLGGDIQVQVTMNTTTNLQVDVTGSVVSTDVTASQDTQVTGTIDDGTGIADDGSSDDGDSESADGDSESADDDSSGDGLAGDTGSEDDDSS